MTRQDYFTRFKIRNALIQVLAEGMAEDYKAMENDYHPVDGDGWKSFDPQHHFKRMLESAQWSGANSDDEEMELEFDDQDLRIWERLLYSINEKLAYLS